jgi:HPr kinase/phosphorylase
MQVHGALVEVLGIGVLLLGPSGVGKSETALELVARGHRLGADDVVELSVDPAGRLRGRASELIRHHLEIRGIGILFLPDLYGPGCVCDDAAVDLICRLEHWRADADYDRVGLTRATEDLLGSAVPTLLLPVRPSANMATLVEVAVRDHLQRRVGPPAAARLDERLRHRSPSS